MQITDLEIPGLKLVVPKRHGDDRGWFAETFRPTSWRRPVSTLRSSRTTSRSLAPVGTVRGLHFQRHPFAQAKLIRVLAGAILDVAVDLRRESPT